MDNYVAELVDMVGMVSRRIAPMVHPMDSVVDPTTKSSRERVALHMSCTGSRHINNTSDPRRVDIRIDRHVVSYRARGRNERASFSADTKYNLPRIPEKYVVVPT